MYLWSSDQLSLVYHGSGLKAFDFVGRHFRIILKPLAIEVVKGYSNTPVCPSLTRFWTLKSQHPSVDFDQTWHIFSPYKYVEPYWFSKSYVKGLDHRVKYLYSWGDATLHIAFVICYHTCISV